MARKQPAKKAKKKSAARPTARKSAKKSKKAAPKKAAKKAAKKSASKGVKKSAARRSAKPVRRSAPASAKASAGKSTAAKKPVKAAAKAQPKGRLMAAVKSLASSAVAAVSSKKPNLDRPRKTVADVHGIPSSLDLNRAGSAAKSGRAEMREKLSKNNSGGAAITAGDVDADWQSAESVGDEAPGGDNPTPDQDVVDDIGRALGVEYADDEELQGGAEIADRDHNRWELDPASKDDFDDEES
jgi:hypothetical protein